MARIAGIDGCPAGWLRVERNSDGVVSAATFPSAEALFLDAPQFEVMCIDIPIGLPDARRFHDVQPPMMTYWMHSLPYGLPTA